MASYGGIVLRYCHDVKGVIAKLVVGCNIHGIPYSAEHIRAMVIRLLETEKAPGERRAMLHVLLGRVTLLDGQPELTLNLLR